MPDQAWRALAALPLPAAGPVAAPLQTAVAALALPPEFVARLAAELAESVRQTHQRVPAAEVLARLFVAAEPAGPGEGWGFFCLERWPGAGRCELEIYLYPDRRRDP